MSARWRGVAATVLLALALPLWAGPVTRAHAQTTLATPVAVTLTTLSPVAPQPGDVLVIAGAVVNESAEPLSDLGVQLRMSDPVANRGSFDDYAAEPGGDVGTLPLALTPVQPLTAATLAPGARETFRLQVSLQPGAFGLPTSAWQVRELGVAVTGATAIGTETVGDLRTFLPWAPRTAVGPQRLQLAWLWPLVDRPHRDASRLWLDDDLAGALSPGGRLSTLVSAAAAAADQAPPPPPPSAHGGPRRHHRAARGAAVDVPVTWAIDPMLLDDVNAMRSSYQVGGQQTVTGRGTPAAREWLTALRAAVSHADVVPLPYGDPDVAAAVRNGLSTLVGVAATTGRNVLGSLLPNVSLLDAGWPPAGMLDQRAVEALFSDGETSLVLSDTALPPVVVPNQTPSARVSLVTAAGDIPTALSDSVLSTAVTEGATADPRLALQRFLAETLMIEAESPSAHRSILVAPARRWDPAASYADALLADTGKVPWLAPTTLRAILAGPPDTLEREPLTYSSSARRLELPSSYLHDLARMQQLLSQLTSILPPGDVETRPFISGLLRGLSSAWRGDTDGRQTWLDAYSAGLTQMAGGIHIVAAQNSTITLTGHGGKVPVTIANDLGAPAHITVQLDANQRLTLPHNGRVGPVALPAGQQTTVDIDAAAKTSGVFPLEVQLLTPNGQKYGQAVQLFVRSTVYGTITLVITAAATAALLVAVAIRLVRRGIAARRAANAAAS